MIDPKELRLGNLVKYENQEKSYSCTLVVSKLRAGKVSAYGDGISAPGMDGQFQPIPITEEILVKLGFYKKETTSGSFRVYELADFTFNSNHGWWYCNNKLKNQPKYIHQLQNLICSLLGEELDVSRILKL